MGVGSSFGEAYDKSQQGSGAAIPQSGTALFSVRDSDKEVATELAKYLKSVGFDIVATRGTAAAFEAAGIEVRAVNKVAEGRPHIVDLIIDDKADLVINTTSTTGSVRDSYTIRRESLMHKVTYATNISSARAMVEAHKAQSEMRVNKLQDLHQSIK